MTIPFTISDEDCKQFFRPSRDVRIAMGTQVMTGTLVSSEQGRIRVAVDSVRSMPWVVA